MPDFPNGIHHYGFFHVSLSEILKYILESAYKTRHNYSFYSKHWDVISLGDKTRRTRG